MACQAERKFANNCPLVERGRFELPTSTLSEWHSTSELNPYRSGSRLPAAYCFSLWFHLLYQELDYSNKNRNFKWVGVTSIPLFPR